MEVDEATPAEQQPPSRGALRPRERLREQGAAALSDAELLALVLGSGVPGRSASRVGRLLARRHPSELASWPLARWLAVAGVGPARASALVAARVRGASSAASARSRARAAMARRMLVLTPGRAAPQGAGRGEAP